MSEKLELWKGKVTSSETDEAKGTWTMSFDLDEPSARKFMEGWSLKRLMAVAETLGLRTEIREVSLPPSADTTKGRLTDAYGNRFFEVGDLVTRDGTDIHRVVDHNGSDGHAPDGMTVVCVKAPASGWTEVGEEEFNVCRRYEWIDPVADPEPVKDADLPAVGPPVQEGRILVVRSQEASPYGTMVTLADVQEYRRLNGDKAD